MSTSTRVRGTAARVRTATARVARIQRRIALLQLLWWPTIVVVGVLAGLGLLRTLSSRRQPPPHYRPRHLAVA